MTNAPCYTCTHRSTVCHAQCVAYHEWTAKVRKENEARRMGSEADAHTWEVTDKIRKRRNKR